jgi:type IV pilus assembly protein PilM
LSFCEGYIEVNWTRSHKFGKDTVLGLDIGSSVVKMIALSKSDAGYSATAAGIAAIAPAEENNGNVRANTVKAIRECFGQAGVKTKFAVCGVSGPDVAVRDFEFPSLSDEEIEAAVLLEAAQVCPFNAADSAISYQVMPNGNDKTTGVLVAATNTLVQSKTELVRKAGLKCVLMDVDGLALLNGFNGLADQSERPAAGRTVAVLNVGASHTTLAVMDKNGWPFIRDMTYAGDDIIAQVAAQSNASIETVRGILFGDAAAELDLHDNLEKACQRLITDVGETLRYYVAQAQSATVEKLFVCGGFALARGFVELLNNRLGTRAVLWNPFETVHCGASQRCEDILAKSGPAMVVAAGLAMRSI